MTAGRLFWIEFRRNAGIWFVLPIVAVAWYLLDSTRVWIPFLWSDTNELLQEMLILFAGPVLVGLAAWLLGTGISCVAPLASATLGLIVRPENAFAWPVRYPLDARTLAIALSLLALGSLAVTLRGTRDRPEERV